MDKHAAPVCGWWIPPCFTVHHNFLFIRIQRKNNIIWLLDKNRSKLFSFFGEKKIETMVIRIITSWAPHIFNSQWFFSISPPSGLVHYFQTNLCRKENKKKLHSVVELETTKQIVPITSLLFYSRLLMFKVIGGDYSNILYIVRGGPHRKCFRATEWITQIFVAEQKNWLLLYKCRILWWNK